MSYCSNCGSKLAEDQYFCSECGQSSDPSLAEPEVQLEVEDSVPAARVSKKAKIISAALLTTGALLAGGYYFVDQKFSPQTISDDFIEAVKEKDIEKVKGFVNEGQIELKATNQEVKAYVNYLHANPKILSSIADNLQKESLTYEDDSAAASLSEEEARASLKDNGKKFFLFTDYAIEVKPFYATIISEFDKTDLYIDGKKVGVLEDEKEFGPFLPREHIIKAAIKGSYGTAEMEQTIDGSETDGESIEVVFDWKDQFVSLASDHEDAVLFVNGKSTGKTIEEIDELGPVTKDGSIKIYAEKAFDSGKKKTEEVAIKKGIEEVELTFGIEEVLEEAESMEELVEETTESEVTAEETDEEIEIGESSETEAIDETDAISSAIVSHYDNITAGNYQSAYGAFSSARKQKISMDSWSSGFSATLEDNVTHLEVTQINGDNATAYLEMTSYDDNGDGTILVQDWGGYWQLVKENGRWTLDEAELQKISSRVE